MSKFVRTSDNSIYDTNKLNLNKIIGNIKYEIIDNILFKTMYGYEAHLYEYEIIKQAENISDLVDGYWWENSNYKDPIYNPTIYKALERLRAWLDSDRQLGTNTLKDITVYGSIYIKGQGWKHVSKLIYNSDKDDFEEVLL